MFFQYSLFCLSFRMLYFKIQKYQFSLRFFLLYKLRKYLILLELFLFDKNLMPQNYDLVIIGAGVVGIAAAYYALADSPAKNICLIEKNIIGSENRYWSSSFSARQNRLQYNEEYLTRFVKESNNQWERLQKALGKDKGSFMHKEGALWFGDKNTTTSQGNIKVSNTVINKINTTASSQEERIQYTFSQKIMPDSPSYMKAFKPKYIPVLSTNPIDLQNQQCEQLYNQKICVKKPKTYIEAQWDTWQALYQKDGGSINMRQSYNSLLAYIKSQKVIQNGKSCKIYDFSQIQTIQTVDQTGTTYKIQIKIKSKQNLQIVESKTLVSSKIFVSTGVQTPFFLKKYLNVDHILNGGNQEFSIQSYVASYFKIDESKQQNGQQYFNIYSNLPNYINFFPSKSDPTSSDQSGYGFRYHQWDNLHKPDATGHYVKLGTMVNIPLQKKQGESVLTYQDFEQFCQSSSLINQKTDKRVLAAKNHVQTRMKGLISNDPGNAHFACPIIFYTGRQTILDYLNRKNRSIVVQTGGWVAKYYPLLAKTAIQMLLKPEIIQTNRRDPKSVIGNFINRTRFPIKKLVNSKLNVENLINPLPQDSIAHFDTAIIGAGCSGLYSAYRLNRANKSNIGVFQLSHRISGRLKSFNFHNVATPMQLGGMRYIPENHTLVQKIITLEGIPNQDFKMEGDPIQSYARRAYLRGTHSSVQIWQQAQQADQNLITNYKLQGNVVGMTSDQIIAYSFFLIITDVCNIQVTKKVFQNKSEKQIQEEKRKLQEQGSNVPSDSGYYRDYKNYIKKDSQNRWGHLIQMSLRQWNEVKPVLLFPQPYKYHPKQFTPTSSSKIKYYPLYSFGFQNVIQAQFGHQTYQFITDQNGYYSVTSNASYLDQTMTYLLDFGNVTYRTLIGGFDNINYSMANALLDPYTGLGPKKGGIYLGHKLVNIQKESEKYLLTFHVHKQFVPKQIRQAAYQTVKSQQSIAQKSKQSIKTTFSESQKDDAKLYSKHPLNHCQKNNYYQKSAQKLSKNFNQLADDLNYFQVKITANSIILGMPKKSISNLYYQIGLLRQSTEASYQRILKQQRQKFEKNIIGQQVYDQYSGGLVSKISRFNQNKPRTPKNLLELSQTTQTMPAIKIVMSFNKNWWDPTIRLNQKYSQLHKNMTLVNSVQEMRGVSITDLPIRQTLYFSQGSDNLLLASYNDMTTTQFWNTLQTNFSQPWKNSKQIKSQHDKDIKKMKKIIYPKNEEIVEASTTLVRQTLRQLSKVHNIKVKQEWLDQCVYQYWGNDPYGAGYHNFFSGYYIPAIMKCIRKPWDQKRIFFVGQAYSNLTGWVQGAFQTAEHVLREEFGLPSLVIDEDKDYPYYEIGY